MDTKKVLIGLLYYGIFGAIAAATGNFMAPPEFHNGAMPSLVAFGALMAVALCTGNHLERLIWKKWWSENKESPKVWLLGATRLGCYLLLPAILVIGLHLLAPGLFVFGAGWLSVFRMVFMPMAAGAILNFWPVKD